MLASCGLSQKLSVIHFNKGDSEPLSTLAGMDTKSISQTLRTFEASLTDVSALVMPQCDRYY